MLKHHLIPLLRRAPLTPEGWVWCLAGVGLFFTGYFKSINLITLLACFMLALAGLNFWLAGRQLRGLKGKRTIIGPVFAGRPFTVLVDVENASRSGRVGVHLEEGDDPKAHWFAGYLAARQAVHLSFETTIARRGRHEPDALRAWSGHPLGLFRRQRVLLAGPEIIVLPAPGELHRGRLRQFLAQASPSVGMVRSQPRRNPAAQSEFHGLREFRGGDSPRFIHWRTSARRGELMVREFEDTPNDNLLLIVEPALFDDSEKAHDVLETAIRVAATICWDWCRQKGDEFTLAVAGGNPRILSGTTGVDHAMHMLEMLALEEGLPNEGPSNLLDVLARAEIAPAPTLVVTTHESNLPRALAMRFHRSAACINVGAAEHRDFCEL